MRNRLIFHTSNCQDLYEDIFKGRAWWNMFRSVRVGRLKYTKEITWEETDFPYQHHTVVPYC